MKKEAKNYSGHIVLEVEMWKKMKLNKDKVIVLTE